MSLTLSNNSDNTQPESYLGQISRTLRDKKRAMVSSLLGVEYIIKRPDSNENITGDIATIYSFIAQENLECAFFCDPNTNTETVEDLCLIISRRIPEGQHVHITTHANYQKVKSEGEKSSKDLLAYFKVTLKKEIQDATIHTNIITEFIKIYTQGLSNP